LLRARIGSRRQTARWQTQLTIESALELSDPRGQQFGGRKAFELSLSPCGAGILLHDSIKNMNQIRIKFALPLLPCFVVFFNPHLTGAAEQPVKDESVFSQSEQNQHSSDEFKRLDAELTRVYEEQLAKQSSTVLGEALVESQKTWKAFRQADGNYESILGHDGSARIFYFNRRMSYLTRQRIYQLGTPFAAGWAKSIP
jgi:uncharacterized protein YecT (DUF1311 family)